MHSIENQADVDKILAPGGAMEAFEAAKKAGKCRFLGFTRHDVGVLEKEGVIAHARSSINELLECKAVN